MSDRGVAPSWLARSLGKGSPADARSPAAIAAERVLVAQAGSLTYSQIVELLHVSVDRKPPKWWAKWMADRRASITRSERPHDGGDAPRPDRAREGRAHAGS